MEPVFRTLEIAAKTLVAATGTEITYQNLQNIPSTGGAVIAINHTSYVDWLPAALAVHYRGRRIRYMIKAEMQQVKIVNFLIKHTKTIPVDRRAGHKAYDEAVRLLRAGEVVGLMPEATISRSFELKDFKTGAARMALDAGVPMVPLIVWGAQRIWTKDHPRNVGRKKIPVIVSAGRPLSPVGDVEHLDAALAARARRVLVADPAQTAHALVRDMFEVLISMCVRLYGRRSARHRVVRAVTAARNAGMDAAA